MNTIQIDFDVYKALTQKRANEAVTYNDVLREMLGLKPSKADPAPVASLGGEWIVKGVTFPAGTEFRARYKGKPIAGKVEDGALVVNGKNYSSPSAAAVDIVQGATNGWNFWEAKLPNTNNWRLIAHLRK